jgi:signal transduction histidine kinase
MTSKAPPNGGRFAREGSSVGPDLDRDSVLKGTKPLVSPAGAVVLVCILTLLFAAIDSRLPGEIDVAVLYGLSVGACAWSLSRRFLWAVTCICVALTWAGQALGPAPITGHAVLHLLWMDRALVAAGLLVLAAFVHQWIRRSENLDAAQLLLRELNGSLEELVAKRTSALAASYEKLRIAEESLRQSQKMEAIGQLTGGISHDFNNFLTAIIGNLEMIAAGSNNAARSRRLAHSALESAGHAAQLVSHLLAFSRRQELAPQTVQTADFVMNAVPLWRHALGEAIAFESDVPGDVWPCLADRAQLESALLNLVINARDAMPSGGRLTIRARNVTAGEGAADLSAGDYLLLSVSDTGTGIPAEIRQRVCEPFFTTKEVGRGSGLGLSMAYGFARQSGGTLLIESTPGAGTVVSLQIPRAPPESMPEATEEEAGRETEAAPGSTVLIVEDDERVRRMEAEALEGAGYRVLLAENGRDALALLREVERVDLVVSDITMPGGMSGRELAHRVLQFPNAPPVLLTTGSATESGVGSVADDRFETLQKPFRPTVLCARARKLIAGRESTLAAP